MIPFVDLTAFCHTQDSQITRALRRIMRAGTFIHGPDVATFERAFARYLGSVYCVGLASGTDALIAALKSLGIGPGDEVIVPAFTFVSTAFAVIAVGATPVFVDVDDKTLTLDPGCLKHAVTAKTKAILPVHLFGQTCDMASILSLAKHQHVAVIEDAAQAHGSKYRDHYAGTMGNIGCFSFYPSKNLGAMGDAGAIVTRSASIARFVRIYGNIGTPHKFTHTVVGPNSRLDTIQAAVLRIKLSSLISQNQKRRRHAALYIKLLQDLPLTLPKAYPDRYCNYHLFVIRTHKRDLLRSYLNTRGIETGIHYPIPLHLQPSLRFLGYKKGSFPVSEQAAREVLSLPMYPELPDRDIRIVSAAIRTFFTLRRS